ncbi:glycosyltransferase family 4 protein [Cylindrospermopsis raciborskii]|uniref:Group 1 glycosyl transferase n=1 Tax=Cylindrospermopsis raciborskii CENA302 TaxID=1170768 RepID=A0A9Q5QUV0_9CYAN|nr:glycosyltransferase family 4 protein [Cylindrospermopsis raciborskii]NLQ05986.1 glycosyltransferase family 4 protein [Cylindrospermopsis raciborskii MVCC19]OHY32301.1 group 1 glycosyl transferase [Cylindrospermopsis raciborskii MVCC14]OPH08783.1 group 1 glycosyl transferase [Cylindrospermopsis raciborskii CENA302]
MEDISTKSVLNSASILTVGSGWFPTTPGGMERYIYELIHKLAINQDQIELCGVGLPEQEDISIANIRLHNLASPHSKIWQRLWSIRSNFRQINLNHFDAVNLHFALYSFPILDLLPKSLPITFNFHGPWAAESQEELLNKQLTIWIKQHLVEKNTYNQCDRFIVLSRAFGNILHQQYEVPWEKIHIIPGGVDVKHFKNNLSRLAAREQLGWPTERPILFTSRRLVHRMGIDKLLTAIAKIKPVVPDIWLAIAGRGHIQNSLEKQAVELGLENQVRFLGFLPDQQLPVAYQAADLTVMPSQSFEGFGLAILESLACGTPVLCTPVGGMPEILQPFTPELITDSIAVDSLANKLQEVMLAKIVLPTREECRNYAAENYDWTNIAQRVRQVIVFHK